MNNKEVIKLVCSDCGGALEIDTEKMITFCPYCGSRNLIPEEKDVTISRIKYGTIRDVKLAAEQTRIAKEQARLEKKRLELEQEKENNKYLPIVLPFLLVLVALMLFMPYLIDFVDP